METTHTDITQLKSVFDSLYSIENMPEEILVEDSPDSKDLKNGLSNVSGSILDNLLNFEMDDWLKQNLAPKTKFFRTLSVQEILAFDSDALSSPFTNLDSSHHFTASKAYKKLLCYVGKRKSVKTPHQNVMQALNILSGAPQEVVDEVFVQTMHLILAHPTFKEKAFSFLAIISTVYVPSESLFNAILAFLFKKINAMDDHETAHYIFARLYATKQYQRQITLSTKEIEFIEHRKAITLKLDAYGDKFLLVPIESYYTTEMVLKEVLELLQIPPSQHGNYGLAEFADMGDSLEERCLERTENVCEVLAKQEFEISKKEGLRPPSFSLYIRLEVFFDHDPSDIDTISYLVNQVQHDIGVGKFVCAEDEIVELASLYLVSRFKNNTEEAHNFIEKRLSSLIPPSKLSFLPKIQWVEKIIEAYKQIAESNPNETRVSFLEKATELFNGYKKSIFSVKVYF